MKFNKEQLENYSLMVIAFNNKLNKEAPEKLLPIMSAYAASMHEAGNDRHITNNAVTVFSEGVHAILSDCLKDYLTIQSETFYLNLTAAEELGDIITRLEKQFDGSFNYTRQLLKDYIDNYPDQHTVTAYSGTIRQSGRETEQILAELATLLRNNCT
jgi:hypothetical protein